MTQNDLVLNWLKAHGSIDPMTALNQLGIYRLAPRVLELRQRGHAIEMTMVESASGARHAVYKLAPRRMQNGEGVQIQAL